MNAEMIKITVQHTNQDPILEPQAPRIETAECAADPSTVTNTLRRLCRRFTLPNGGTFEVTANGRTVRFDSEGSIMMLARQLLM